MSDSGEFQKAEAGPTTKGTHLIRLANEPQHLIRSKLRAIVAAVFLWQLGAQAQSPTPLPVPPPADEERVIVMQDNIPVTESEGVTRVWISTNEAIKKGGANTPAEGLRSVPFFIGTTRTENDSLGGDGSAFINLYALGARNVVTLLNGRRAFGFANMNAISLSALLRVEIMDTDVYGSDSTGGVANFVMLNGPGEMPYEGAELQALYGNTTDSDAHVRQVYFRGGVTGLHGKVAIAAAAEYYSRAALFSRDREISRTGDLSNDATGLGLGGINNNSTVFAGRISLSGPGGGRRVLIDLTNNAPTPGSYRAFDVPPGTDPSRFNSGAFTPAIPAVEKSMSFVTGRYKIFGDGLQIYGDLLYSKTKQDNAVSPTTISFSGIADGLDDVRSSPFNPFPGNTLTALSYRTLQELGLRKSFYDQDYYRYVAGMNGDFSWDENPIISRFGYDTGLVYERADLARTDSGDLTRAGIRDQIRLGNFDPFIGQFAPPVGIAPIYANGVQIGTRAYDNTAGARAASYLGHSFFYERDWLADFKINAHLFPNWWNGGIDVAAIYEHRESNSKQIPDAVQAANDTLGFDPVPPFKFRQEVDSWHFEIGVPLVTAVMNVPLIRSLEFTVGWRRDEFSDTSLFQAAGSPIQTSASFVNKNPEENFGGSPTVTLRYQPTGDIMLRSTWHQSIRPPAFEELFTPVRQMISVIGIPGIAPPGAQATWISGNPELRPETTDTYSTGIVWSPEFFSGFYTTLDVYQMFTTNVVLDPDSVTETLLAQNTLDPDGCGLGLLPGSGPAKGLTRNRDNGAIDCVDSGFANGGKRLVQGLVATAVYELPTEHFGKLTLSGGWNHFFTWKGQRGSGSTTTSFLGNYDNRTLPFAPGAIPWNKGFLRGEWEWKGFDFVATGNYVGDFRDDPSFETIARAQRRNVPSYITLDLQLSYEWKKPEPDYVYDGKDQAHAAYRGSVWQRLLWGTRLTAGVNNAFDRNPPTVLAALNDNYDTSLYSLRNRYCYIAVSKKF